MKPGVDIGRQFDFLFAMLIAQQFRLDAPDEFDGKLLIRHLFAQLRRGERNSGACQRALRNAHHGMIALYGDYATIAVDEVQAQVIDLLRSEFGVDWPGRWWR